LTWLIIVNMSYLETAYPVYIACVNMADMDEMVFATALNTLGC